MRRLIRNLVRRIIVGWSVLMGVALLAEPLDSALQAQTRDSTPAKKADGKWSEPKRNESALTDSTNKAPAPRYQAGGMHRWMLGDTYRDLWVQKVRVPVLHIQTYAGGLEPTKTGGGLQTKSLRMTAANGTEYVFRMSDKSVNSAPKLLRDTPADKIFQDQVSAMHPAAAPISASVLRSAHVLHPTAVLMVMGDDEALGEYRKDFAGRFGMLEEYPTVPKEARGFAGAKEIIDSDDLLKILNRNANERVDERAYLQARLVDYLLNDTDRHQGNWKWARMNGDSPVYWEPIARDRDHALLRFDGWVVDLVRKFSSTMVSIDDPPSPKSITQARILDGRLLESLNRSVWDSSAHALISRMSDGVIDSAIANMPREYAASAPRLRASLIRRRDALPLVSSRFYEMLAKRVEVHGTDSADHAVVTRTPDGKVRVAIKAKGREYYNREFDPKETSEVLVMLQNGDDTADVRGSGEQTILVRVIGGNGVNTLSDSSAVNGRNHKTRFYDEGKVSDIEYGADTLFDRRPWEHVDSRLSPPLRDYGATMAPTFGLSFHRRIGITPALGFERTTFGYRQRPYASYIALNAEYAGRFDGYRVTLSGDKRLESSPLHFRGVARVSDFEVVQFNGYGNATVDSGETSHYFEVRQRQWMARPALALAVGSRLDLTLGPVIQHSQTDSLPNHYLSATRPYGFGSFNQAALQFGAVYEWRGVPGEKEQHTHHRVAVNLNAFYFPAVLDVEKPFSKLTATAGTSITIPVPLLPLFIIRTGAEKLYGDFPFHEAATIGGQGSTRYMDTQRFSGDAAMYASSELRVPLAKFHFIVPVRAGVLGLAEGGRVYYHGESPGGWYSRTGEGVWFGRGEASPVVTISRTTEPNHKGWHVRFGLNF